MMETYSVLAVETSTVACSVALIDHDRTYQRYEILPQKHAHRLLEMVDEVLCEAGMKGQDVDVLAYGEGPGAFTGVRIAAGVVQGLALGWDKPVIGISSLEAMAERVLSEFKLTGENVHSVEVPWCALMDARMQEVYFQSGVFNLETKEWQVSKACLISPEKAEKLIKGLGDNYIGLGDVSHEYPGLTNLFIQWFDTLPSAVSVGKLSQRIDLEDHAIYQGIALPVYLRNHVADTIQERQQNRLKNNV